MDFRAFSTLLLTALLFIGSSVRASEPEISDEPDFYSSPGVSSGRSYDFGDNLVIDTFGGTLQTQSSDLVVNGNGPVITVLRAYNSVPSVISNYSYMGPGWDIHFGRIVGRYTCFEDTLTYQTTKLFFIKPDGGQVQILPENAIFFDYNQNNVYDPSVDYKPTHITSDFWRAECRGNSLVVTDTRDTDYIFGASDSPDVYAKQVVVRVEDSTGNYLTINYTLANGFSRPVSILGSDGREVLFTYDADHLIAVTDGMFTVNYQYSGDHLTSVVFPEEVVWQYAYLNNSRLLSNVISPLGADISLSWDTYYFRSKDYPVVTSKCIQENCWVYSYQREYSTDNGVVDKTTIVTPYATREEFTHLSPLAVQNDGIWKIGLLVRKDIFREPDTQAGLGNGTNYSCPLTPSAVNADAPIESFEYSWQDVEYSGATRSYVNNGVYLIDQQYRKPVLQSTLETRDGESFSYEVVSFNVGGVPEIEREEGSKTRYTKNTYLYSGHYQAEWLLNLPATKSVSDHDGNYEFVSGVEYNELGQVVRKIESGSETLFDYYANGLLRSVTDGVGYETLFSNYYRGVPRRVDYPNLTYITRTVDDRGRVIAETNQNSITTTYQYDGLDRITNIGMPASLDVNIDYNMSTNGGMSRRFTQGARQEKYEYDELGNVFRHTQSDTASGVNLVRKYDYDVRNNLVFASDVNQPTRGTHYEYDRLGNLTRTYNNEGEDVRQKVQGLWVKTTDAECNETTQYFDAYSSSDLQLKQVVGPEGLQIDITRNILGQPLTVTQNGIVRTFEYNANWKLSQYQDPEADALHQYYYNAAGRLVKQVSGINDQYYIALLAYDQLGRLTNQSYSTLYVANQYPWELFMPASCTSSTGGIGCRYTSYADRFAYYYDAVGNLTSKVKFTTTSRWGWSDLYPVTSEDSTSWTYDFDDEGHLLSEELLTFDDRIYRLSYDYNNNGYRTSTTYPAGEVINYAPDALGRATRVGNIVTAIQYHDTGSVQTLTYGNGQVVNYTLNARNLIDGMTAYANGNTLADLIYDYDLNRNLTLIQDNVTAGRTKAMTYDGLDRLDTASGAWGSAAYQYDAMGNITQKAVGGHSYIYGYSATNNRLVQFDGNTIEYDIYGRVINDGNNRYFYDYSNNLMRALSIAEDKSVTYKYDANNRMQYRGNGMAEHYVYSNAGKLMYEEQRNGDLKRAHIYLGSRLVGYHDIEIGCNEDLDNDGMPHCYERENGLNPYYNDANLDSDGDEITNLQEYTLGTLAGKADSDGDGIDDNIEILYGFDPTVEDSQNDADADGFTNLEEIEQGSDPTVHTDLTPAKQFAAKFATESVIVSWLPVMHADGYDLYWSNTPFTDIAQATQVENVTSPYIQPAAIGEPTRYYRLVTKKDALRSTPSTLQAVDLAGKAWSYLGLVDWYPDEVKRDTAGNIHILKLSNSPLTEVSYWNNDSRIMTGFDVFNFIPKQTKLAVAANGYALLLAFNYDDRSIWTALFDPHTKSWAANKVGGLMGTTRSVSGVEVVASDNGHFALTWVEDDFSTETRWAQAFSPVSGWSPKVPAAYLDASSIYYEQSSIYYHSLEINDAGDMAMIWMLRDYDAGISTAHLLTQTEGGEPQLRYLATLNGSGNFHLGLNAQGQGIAVWKEAITGQSWSQRFDMSQLLGDPTTLGMSDPNVLALNLKDELATVFVAQDQVVQALTQQGVDSWSDPVVSNLNAYSSLRPEAYAVQDNGIQTIIYGDVFRYLNGGVERIAGDPENTNILEYSGITAAGDFAAVGYELDDRGYPLYVYQSQILPENELPIAIAGADQEITTEESFTLQGDLSSDSDGIIVSYQWRQLSGPEVYISGSTKAVAQVGLFNISQAEFEFELTVVDERGGQSVDTVLVSVDNPYGPPTAKAGDDQTVPERVTVNLSASGSLAASANPIVAYSWEQLDGPTVTILNNGTAEASFVAPEVDETTSLQFAVTVSTDSNYYYTDTDTVTVVVWNDELPIADFGADQTVDIGDRVVLDYSNTFDPDGGSISMSFSVVSGGYVQLQGGSAPKTLEFTAPEVTQDTVFTFRVTVTDDEGDTASDDVSVTVRAPLVIAGPTANAGADQTVNASSTVTLDGSGSSAPQGETLTQFQWTQVSGPVVALSNASIAGPQFTAPDVTSATDLVFQLLVTASNGQTASDTATVWVQPLTGNLPPIADAGPDQTVDEGDTVILDARGSSDPDGYSLMLSWSVLSGGMVSLQQGPEAGTLQFEAPQVAFDTDFVFEVTVTDDNGASSTDQVTITVRNTSTPPPAGDCELDFDGNGVVEEVDFFGDNYEGIYYAVYIYLNYNAYYSYYFPNTPVEKLDWNGDGNITIEEVYTGTISTSTLDTFQTQHWFYLNNKNAYATYYPDSGCAL